RGPASRLVVQHAGESGSIVQRAIEIPYPSPPRYLFSLVSRAMAGSEDPRQPMGLSSYESLESLLAAQSDCHQPATLIPRPRTSDIRCCCGQDDCVFLRHNDAQLHGLERNVQTAAQMGQVYCQLNLPWSTLFAVISGIMVT